MLEKILQCYYDEKCVYLSPLVVVLLSYVLVITQKD